MATALKRHNGGRVLVFVVMGAFVEMLGYVSPLPVDETDVPYVV